MASASWPIPYILLDGVIGSSFGSSSSVVALPGTPTNDKQVLITNLGPCHVAVLLLTGATGSVTPSTGLVVLAGQCRALGLSGTQDHIVGVSCGGPNSNATVNIATGN